MLKIEERHLLEENAIALEKAAESASRRTHGLMNAGWSRKTVTAFRNAARTLRKQLAEEAR